jgi:hypothetical protein
MFTLAGQNFLKEFIYIGPLQLFLSRGPGLREAMNGIPKGFTKSSHFRQIIRL